MLNNKTIASCPDAKLSDDLSSNINLINQAYDQRTSLNNPDKIAFKLTLQPIIKNILTQLEAGSLRVAAKINDQWTTNLWVKKAILLSFMINDNQIIYGANRNYFDKITPRFQGADLSLMQSIGARIVPPACIRTGAYVANNTIIMPSYLNIGSVVEEGSMIDSWATIGSCAQIGKNVHIATGVCIGGVLEPMQDQPTIIEDNCFIGANASIVEGVIIEKNSVIAAGVSISQSTKIYDRETDSITYGKVPSGSVVVSGSLATNGKYNLYCAVIVKKVDQQTLAKTAINEILRSVTD